MRNHLEWLRPRSTIIPRPWSVKLFFIVSCCFMLMPALGGTAFAYNRYNATSYTDARALNQASINFPLMPAGRDIAFAYNRDIAVSYADEWALSRNSWNFPSYDADCTNFVSQALVSGGYSFVGTPQFWSNSTDDYQWWGNWNWVIGYWFRTYSWSVAPDQFQFQWNHYPGGWEEDVVTASDARYWYHYDNVNMIGGDELFFDWGKGEGMSHVALQVWSGYSQYTSSSWYGDLSDQHTTDRYHVSWSHIEVNADWPTTTIWEVHIDDGN
jgi:hypothetical protein